MINSRHIILRIQEMSKECWTLTWQSECLQKSVNKWYCCFLLCSILSFNHFNTVTLFWIFGCKLIFDSLITSIASLHKQTNTSHVSWFFTRFPLSFDFLPCIVFCRVLVFVKKIYHLIKIEYRSTIAFKLY